VQSDDETSDKVFNESNVAGMKRWYVDGWACLNYWVENGSPCGRCISACPYNKPKAFAHDLVKGIASKTSILNGTFIAFDKALGYGGQLEDGNDPLEWWTQDENPQSWFRGSGGA
jgi:ferredoxin